jgi:hypothetical protein
MTTRSDRGGKERRVLGNNRCIFGAIDIYLDVHAKYNDGAGTNYTEATV